MEFINNVRAREYAHDANYAQTTVSIMASIYNAISNQLVHCDWYSPVNWDIDDSNFQMNVSECVSRLKELGYKITYTRFEPNKDYVNPRIKLHINWE